MASKAAVAAKRLTAHDGHGSRVLQEKASRYSSWQPGYWMAATIHMTRLTFGLAGSPTWPTRRAEVHERSHVGVAPCCIRWGGSNEMAIYHTKCTTSPILRKIRCHVSTLEEGS